MAYTSGFTAVSGATFTAAQYNTNVRDNFSAIWVGTTAGDMDYYTSATAKSRLALVTGGILVGGASAPQYLANTAKGILIGGASSPQYLALGAAYTFLKSDGSAAPFYGSLVYQRQGNDADNWQSAGPYTFGPTKTQWLAGAESVTVNPTGDKAITYPTAFTKRPIILLGINSTNVPLSIAYKDDSTTGFTAYAQHLGGGSGTFTFNWVAIGE